MTDSRNKGKRGELELSHVLEEMFGVYCHRGQQYSGERGNPDVVGLTGVHIECKRVERLMLLSAVRQSKSDARPDEVPVVIHRTSRAPWLVTVELEQLPALAERIVRIVSGGVANDVR